MCYAKKTIIIASILGGLLLLIGAFWLGRISAESRQDYPTPNQPKNNLPPQKPEKPDDNPDNSEPVPGNRKEGKFDYITFFKERDNNYCIFRNIREGVNPKDWKVIYVSEDHPLIKQLLSQGKLQLGKQFTIHYGKADEVEKNLWLTFNENNRELEIIEA